MKLMHDYVMAVKGGYIRSLMDQLVVNFHRFPGTASTVAHSSLLGWEVAIASAPAADSRNYNQTLGETMSRSRVLILSEKKVWEDETVKMYDRFKAFTGTDEEFRHLHQHIYTFSPAPRMS